MLPPQIRRLRIAIELAPVNTLIGIVGSEFAGGVMALSSPNLITSYISEMMVMPSREAPSCWGHGSFRPAVLKE